MDISLSASSLRPPKATRLVCEHFEPPWMFQLCIAEGMYMLVLLQGPEQNALGNLLVLFLLAGIFVGAVSDWLWLIGKGW